MLEALLCCSLSTCCPILSAHCSLSTCSAPELLSTSSPVSESAGPDPVLLVSPLFSGTPGALGRQSPGGSQACVVRGHCVQLHSQRVTLRPPFAAHPDCQGLGAWCQHAARPPSTKPLGGVPSTRSKPRPRPPLCWECPRYTAAAGLFSPSRGAALSSADLNPCCLWQQQAASAPDGLALLPPPQHSLWAASSLCPWLPPWAPTPHWPPQPDGSPDMAVGYVWVVLSSRAFRLTPLQEALWHLGFQREPRFNSEHRVPPLWSPACMSPGPTPGAIVAALQLGCRPGPGVRWTWSCTRVGVGPPFSQVFTCSAAALQHVPPTSSLHRPPPPTMGCQRKASAQEGRKGGCTVPGGP